MYTDCPYVRILYVICLILKCIVYFTVSLWSFFNCGVMYEHIYRHLLK